MIIKIRAALLLSMVVAVLSAAEVTDTSVRPRETPKHLKDCPLVRIVPERMPDLTIPRGGHCIFYAGGELVLAGGHTTNFVPTQKAEYFADGKWHQLTMAYTHDHGFAVLMRSGEVIIGGGHAEPLGIGQTFMLERYIPEKHFFEGYGCMDRKRALANGVRLADGRVIIAGNHFAKDGIGCYNGNSQVEHLRDVVQDYSSPWILRTADDDVIVVGGRDARLQPLDTIWATRVRSVAADEAATRGEAFRVPLLEQYHLLFLDRPFNSDDSYIDDYTCLLPATDNNGQLVIVMVCAPVESDSRLYPQADSSGEPSFKLLPTACPVPMQTKWGKIEYCSHVVVDRKSHFGYVVGHDSTTYNHQFVLRIDYSRQPAGLTLFYTDSLEHATDAIPVLTPEGDLILAGGITNSNYKPLASVWRYPFGSHNQEAGMEHGTDTRGDTFSYLNVKRAGPVWLWALVAVLLIVFVAYIIYIRHGRRVAESPQTPGYAPMMEQVCQFLEEDKRYLKNVRQSDVATTLGVDVATLADCIRISRGCTFAQLIAEYRVRHAQQLISDNPQLKLAVVIAESGFTSESTFFRTFKAVTGKTPKEWLSDNT